MGLFHAVTLQCTYTMCNSRVRWNKIHLRGLHPLAVGSACSYGHSCRNGLTNEHHWQPEGYKIKTVRTWNVCQQQILVLPTHGKVQTSHCSPSADFFHIPHTEFTWLPATGLNIAKQPSKQTILSWRWLLLARTRWCAGQRQPKDLMRTG